MATIGSGGAVYLDNAFQIYQQHIRVIRWVVLYT